MTRVRRLISGLRRQWAWLGRLARLRQSLRFRAAVGIGLPILVALSVLSLMHYWRERHLLEDQARLTATQIGYIVVGSLRQSLAAHDIATIGQMLSDIRGRQSIDGAQIVDLDGNVLVDGGRAQPGLVQHVVEPGCTTCHRVAPESRPHSAIVASDVQIMRVAVPIFNDPECAVCHTGTARHLAILLVEVPLRLLLTDVVRNLKIDLAISALITLMLTVSLYGLLHRLVVRRVEALRQPLAAYAGGNFDVRLPSRAPGDEIDQLGVVFNRMADQLERQAREEHARSELRHRAIVEERERIARELHDGLAQVLGYVHTKATAVRLLLRRQDLPAAERQLGQLEEAARGLFVDVREAILGLRTTTRRDGHLAGMLREYTAHFSELADLPVEVDIAPNLEAAVLPPEAELQLLRIVQEALSNVRKHAQATCARVSMSNGGPLLEVNVSDDGRGFCLDQPPAGERRHFGLGTMRERAEAIGAEFQLESRVGAGTRVLVRLPLAKG